MQKRKRNEGNMNLSKKFKKKLRKNLSLAIVLVVTLGAIFVLGSTNNLSRKLANLRQAEERKGEEIGAQTQEQEQEIIQSDESQSDSKVATTTFANPAISQENTQIIPQTQEDIGIDHLGNAQVASGNTFSVVLKANGTVFTWGNNQYGQLGKGDVENVNHREATQVIGIDGIGHLENIQQISVGSFSVMALTHDGRVVAWGRNDYGQLGRQVTGHSGIPSYVLDETGKQITGIKQISAGSSHMLAIKENGEVLAWGLNNYGQLGINTASTTGSNAQFKRLYAVNVKKSIEITDENGTTTNQLVNLDNIKQVSGGTDFSVVLTNEGEVYCFGLGTNGQIGNGVAANTLVPTKTDIEDVQKIDAGGLQAIALKQDGTVWAWGINRYGNLGIATSSTSTSNAAYQKTRPVEVLIAAGQPLTNIVDISSIAETSYALTEDGSVYGWGRNTYGSNLGGQLGDYTTANKNVATKMLTKGKEELKNIKLLPDGQNTTANIMADKDGYLYATGIATNERVMSDTVLNMYYAKKIDETYLELSHNQEYLEVGKTIALTTSYHHGLTLSNHLKVAENIQYRSSNENIATVDSNGVVTAKKRGIVTIIAENQTNGDIAQSILNIVSPNAIAIPNVVSGTTFTAMLKEDGTVWATGANTVGELGNGTVINTKVPTQVKIDTNTYLTDIRKIEVGAQHVVALRKDGTVWTWGLNSAGQLGIGNTSNASYAMQVWNTDGSDYLTQVVDISSGYDFSLAITKDKNVYGWGAGANHTLGVNSTANQLKPIKIHDTYNIIQAQGQNDTTIVLKGDGSVWGTGYNNVGQLGDSTTSTRAELTPTINATLDGALTGVVRITSGLHFTIALKEDKTAWVWGQNNQGQFGVATPTSSKSPIELAGNNIQNIGTGPYATYIENVDGKVEAVGLNTTGELSIGNKTTVKVLTRVKDETGANDIGNIATLGRSMATTYGFALADGSVGITGQGTSGQHGNGTLTASNNITKIEDGKISVEDIYEIEPNETAKIQVNRRENFNLNIENTIKMPEGNITYTSQDDTIATVTPDGTITGVKAGTTGITVRDETNNLECVANVIVGKRDLSNISKIVSGDNFTVLLKQDGTVWSWGNNAYGQLGNGNIENKNEIEPQKVLGINGQGYLDHVIDIAAGASFVVALRENGEVITWGRNDYGQLGTANGIAANPIRVQETGGNYLRGVVQVSAARDHAAALKADGTVFAWGRNDYGQLGQNDKTNSTYAVPVKDSTGTGILRNISQVRVGGAFVATVTKEGTVYTWGCGSYGRLGNAGTGHKLLPVVATGVNDVKKIVVGHYHAMVLKNDGTVWSWGFNRYGQLGIGAASTSSSNANYQKTTQVQVKLDASNFLSDVVDIGANLETSYALTSDGTLYAWGLNTEGQMADMTIVNKSYPTKSLRNYKEELEKGIVKLQYDSANGYTNYAIKADGSIIGNGRNTSGQMMYTSNYKYVERMDHIFSSYLEITDRISYLKQGESKKLTARIEENLNAFAKSPEMGNLTWESTNQDIATVDGNGNVTAKKTGMTTIIVKEDRWGYTAQAKIYVTANQENSITAPMVVQGTSFTGILKADGTVWTAGKNNVGQLGVGDSTYRGEPTRVKIDENTELSNVTRIAAGATHMLAVTQNGDVYAWGQGNVGQLGQGNTNNSNYAVKVQNLSNVIDVAAGGTHSVALTKDGKMYMWGAGANYRLGNNATANQTLPIYVYRSYNIVEISAGGIHTVCVSGDGMAWGVGGNTYGQIGTNQTTDKCVLIEMQNGTNQERIKNIISIKAGGNHNIALTKEGKVYVGGYNNYSQLGKGDVAQSNVLVPATTLNEEGEVIELENIATIAAGNSITFAVSKKGESYGTGLNTAGQLAVGNNTSPVKRFTKIDLPNVEYASHGEGNTINSGYITSDGKVYTAGTGTDGQLADGQFLNSYEPVIVGNNEIEVPDINVSLQVGENYTILPKLVQGMNVYNYESTIKNIAYQSNNPKVASVDATGRITANQTGSAIIEIKDLDNNIQKYIKVDVAYYKDFAEPDVSSGLNFTIALKADGSVWSWGNGASGRLGTGNTNNQTEAVPVLAPNGKDTLKNVKQVVAGYDNASALLADGTVVSWGNAGSTSLGNNAGIDSSIPVYVVDAEGNKLSNVIKIGRGNDYGVALKADGTVWTWGYNKYGQLGQNHTSNSAYAVQVKDQTGKGYLKDILDISVTMYSCTAMTGNGEAWAFGLNTSGQLGIGSTDNSLLPKKVQIENSVKIVSGAYHVAALKPDGTIWAWGWNGYGQLSDGTTTNRTLPIQMKKNATEFVENVMDVGSTGATLHILDKDHKVYGAGVNAQGQLGDRTTTNRSYFVELKGKYGEEMPNNIVKLTYSIARPDSSTDTSVEYYIREDGSLYGTGKNNAFQLFGQLTENFLAAKEMNQSYLEIERNSYLKVGESKQLTPNVVQNFNLFAKTPTVGTLTWTSSNENIATVDNQGNVLAKEEGQTTIRVQDSKYGYIATSTIYVTRNTQNTITIPQVAQGVNYTIVLKADGTVWGTGINSTGELGRGQNTPQEANLQPVKTKAGDPLTNIVKISSGLSHNMALTKTGEVYVWGLNANGQLGQGNTTNLNVATPMQNEFGTGPVKNIIDISAGRLHSTVLTKDGKVYQCGINNYGQLGDNTTATRTNLVKVKETENICQIATAQYYTAMLRGDGTVWSVGQNYYGTLGVNTTTTGSGTAGQGLYISRQAMNNSQDAPLRNVTQIATGGWHTVALTTNKKVYTWGYGSDGQLGQNNTSNYSRPMLLLDETAGADGVSDVMKIGTSERSTFVLKTNKDVYATGENSNYQLSQNDTTDLKILTKLYDASEENYIGNIANVIQSSANTYNTAIIQKDGSVWVSGKGNKGQVGNDYYIDAKVYTRMGNSSIAIENTEEVIAVGQSKKLLPNIQVGFNVYEDEKDALGQVTFTSQNPEIVSVTPTGEITALKQGSSRISIYDPTNRLSKLVLVKVTRDVEDQVYSEISGKNHGILLRTDGSVVTWGDNTYGQLGVGNTTKQTGYVEIFKNGIKSIARGENHSAAVTEDGKVLTWGLNNYGQLGNGTNSNQSSPVYMIDDTGAPITNVLKVRCGNHFTVVLKKDGSVWACGRNDYGLIGDNTRTNRNIATRTKDTTGAGYLQDVADISVADINVAVLTHSKDVYVWGYNYQGQLGNGTTNRGTGASGQSVALPRKANISDVDKIICNTRHLMAIKADGTVWSWGYNGYGQLGIGTSGTSSGDSGYCRTTPVQVKISANEFLTNVADIGITYYTTYVLRKDGTIYSFGYNANGTKGDNTTNNTNSGYASVLKDRYGASFEAKISRLENNNYSSSNFFICDDGTILGHGYQNGGRLLNVRSGNQLTPMQLEPDYMELNKRAVSLKQGESTKLEASVKENLNAYVGHIKLGTLQWHSFDTNVATVDNNGNITAVGLGETTITVKDTTNGYQAQAIISVIQNHEKAIAVPNVTQGNNFTAILKADGTVWTTGLNSEGQLGDGTTYSKSKPVQVKISNNQYLTGITKIYAGSKHVVALSQTQEVYVWGSNTYGQLGDGTTTKSVYAKKVLDADATNPIKDVIGIASGVYSSYVLKADGTVYGFGWNERGQLGLGNHTNKTLPSQVIEGVNIVNIQAGDSELFMQKGDGTLLSVGYNLEGELGQNMTTNTASNNKGRSINLVGYVINSQRNGILKNVVKVVGGGHQFIALTEDNQAYTWGYNAHGQLGTGNKTNYAYPMQVNLEEKILDIGAAHYRTLVKTDKNTYITGHNNYGQIGNNSTENSINFIPIGETIDILPKDSSANNNSSYIDKNGKVWTAGLNNYGQIGDDTLYQRKEFVEIGEVTLRAEETIFNLKPQEQKQINVTLEDTFNVYLKEEILGKLTYQSLDENVATVDETGKVTAKGVGTTLIKIIDNDKNIRTAIYVKVIKDQDDMVYEPMVVGGENHSMALKGDGTVWGWGNNKFGQLGNNSTITTEIPTKVVGLQDVKMIAAGSNHTLALKNDGTVWAWGYNNVGQLGDNTQIVRYEPVQVLGEDGEGYLKDIVYIAAGTNYSAAINKKGEVWTWGLNTNGQLGDGSTINKYTPVRVKANLNGIIQIACGNNHMIAVKADGTAYTWGYNQYGKLGDNTTVQRTIPVQVLQSANTAVEDIIAVEASHNNSYLIKADGTVLSVGYGANGGLGNSATANQTLPVQVVNPEGTDSLKNIATIKAGANTVYVLDKQGKVYTWGLGTNGQLGNHDVINSNKPTEVKDGSGENALDKILYLGAGWNHGLVVGNDGYIQVWGANNSQQLGTLSITRSTLPIYIGSKIIATPNNVRMEIGDTRKITIEMNSFNLFKPEDELSRTVSFQSLNDSVVTVSNDGTLTAVGNGITKVVATDSLSRKSNYY